MKFNLRTLILLNNLSNRYFKITISALSHNSSSSKKLFYISKVNEAMHSCSTNKIVFAKGDSAVTGHFFMMCDASVLKI